jgi:hypothetical protein
MADEVRAVAGWVREHEAEAALDRAPGSLSPEVYASIAACCEADIQLSQDGRLRVWSDGGPHEVHIDRGVFDAVARLAHLAGLRPEQYIEQLIKRHVRSIAPFPPPPAKLPV